MRRPLSPRHPTSRSTTPQPVAGLRPSRAEIPFRGSIGGGRGGHWFRLSRVNTSHDAHRGASSSVVAGSFDTTGSPLFGFSLLDPFGLPLQHASTAGARFTRGLQSPGTFRPQGFAPSRRLASPAALQACFILQALLGFTRRHRPRSTFRSHAERRIAEAPSSRNSPLPRRPCLRRTSSLALPRNQESFDPTLLTRAPESRSRKDRLLSASKRGARDLPS